MLHDIVCHCIMSPFEWVSSQKKFVQLIKMPNVRKKNVKIMSDKLFYFNCLILFLFVSAFEVFMIGFLFKKKKSWIWSTLVSWYRIFVFKPLKTLLAKKNTLKTLLMISLDAFLSLTTLQGHNIMLCHVAHDSNNITTINTKYNLEWGGIS